ncbi:hypothetical protein G6F31_021718 [Rhizopus arrhizus]|nr:hypothetical protein G6F31_021718 [Rhizopus arrhizus]
MARVLGPIAAATVSGRTIWSTTISSPLCSSENKVAEMAAMPDAGTTPASAPSSDASRSSSSACVGLRVRP